MTYTLNGLFKTTRRLVEFFLKRKNILMISDKNCFNQLTYSNWVETPILNAEKLLKMINT